MRGVIAICGVDGSGKSTQVKLLEKYLSQKGFKVKRVWFRWVAFLSYPFLALCRFLGYTRWRTVARSNVKYAERRFYLNKALAKVWPWLFAIDTFINFIFRIKFRKILGYVILCDRFIPDVLVDLMCETRDFRLPRRVVGRILLSLVPGDSKLVIVDVREKTAYTRKNDIPSLVYLKERRKLYLYLARVLNIPIVNGEMKIHEVNTAILRLLKIIP
jgi:dTMP kinase